jgi:hypothetical protein
MDYMKWDEEDQKHGIHPHLFTIPTLKLNNFKIWKSNFSFFPQGFFSL